MTIIQASSWGQPTTNPVTSYLPSPGIVPTTENTNAQTNSLQQDLLAIRGQARNTKNKTKPKTNVKPQSKVSQPYQSNQVIREGDKQIKLESSKDRQQTCPVL